MKIGLTMLWYIKWKWKLDIPFTDTESEREGGKEIGENKKNYAIYLPSFQF